MSIIRSRRSRVIIGVIAALALAGAAIAYWTTSGTGQGTATVGTDSGVSIGGVAFTGALYPGAKTGLSFTITNLSANTAVRVAQVVADNSVFTNGIEVGGGCDQADFTFPNTPVNQSIPASASISVTVPTASGLSFANTTFNQDVCKNKPVILHLKAL